MSIEAGARVLGPESETWRNVLDWRLLLGAGRALLLQVAHPTVGAGVAQFSNYQAEPWQRLRRTIDSLMVQTYGGSRTIAEARRLRELHKGFQGIDHHGDRYHALNPEAYGWVHATLFEGSVSLHADFGTPLPIDRQRRMYQEWRDVGRIMGLKPHQMPADLTAFTEYFDDMVANRLEDNESVRTLLAMIGARGPVPPWWPLPRKAWRLVEPVAGKAMSLATVGTLPAVLRHRLGLQWTDWDQRGLAALKVAVKAGMPLLPDKVRYHPMALAARRAARK